MKLPVSVIVPTIPSRIDFLVNRCLPSIRANGEVEILVEEEAGNGSVKRNRGLKKATMPYLLFVDDDSILRPNCISRMLEQIEGVAFVYSDYERIFMPGVQSVAPSGRFVAGQFDVRRLRSYNYINTTSLIRAEGCPQWDEKLLRFQDWDFWLSVVLGGRVGKYIPEVLYELWQIDASVSNTVKANPYIDMIVAKHRLNT